MAPDQGQNELRQLWQTLGEARTGPESDGQQVIDQDLPTGSVVKLQKTCGISDTHCLKAFCFSAPARPIIAVSFQQIGARESKLCGRNAPRIPAASPD